MRIVLAVAEDRSLRESLSALLSSTDLLLCDGTVDDALRRMVTVDPDVILLDDAPNLGITALKRLMSESVSAPVVVLSAKGSPEAVAAFRMAGARDCVSKPFHRDELVRAMGQAGAPRTAAAEIPLRTPDCPPDGIALGQYKMALRWMSRCALYLEEPTKLAGTLVDAVVDVFDAARVGVVLQSNNTARVAASHGLSDALVQSLRLSYTEGLMYRLEQRASMIRRDVDGTLADAMKEMQLLGANTAIPLFIGGQTCGALLIGDKISGATYDANERDLLAVMARSVSACLEKAQKVRDVTRQQSRLDAVLSNITAGVVTVRPDKTISMMNESAERILQIRSIDVLGKSVQKLGSTFADIVLRTMAESRPYLRQEIFDKAIDSRLGLSVTPLGSEGVVAIFTALPSDDTEVEHIDYSPIWQYLSSRVAQEIKNPLVAISTFAQLLPEKYDSKEFREEFATVVQSEVNRINRVVESLYEFSSHPRLSMERTNLNENVKHVLEMFEEAFTAHKIEVSAKYFPEDIDVTLDPTEFSKVLRHVIQNSVDAMPNGGTLTVETVRSNGVCRLKIANTGEPIREQDAPHIFEPFFSTKEKGVGLGLTLANRIVREHRGQMKLARESNAGGCFVIELPPAS